MANEHFQELVQEVARISDEEKRALRDMLNEQLVDKNGASGKDLNTFGWAKGRVVLAKDFDGPLEDFKEYME